MCVGVWNKKTSCWMLILSSFRFFDSFAWETTKIIQLHNYYNRLTIPVYHWLTKDWRARLVNDVNAIHEKKNIIQIVWIMSGGNVKCVYILRYKNMYVIIHVRTDNRYLMYIIMVYTLKEDSLYNIFTRCINNPPGELWLLFIHWMENCGFICEFYLLSARCRYTLYTI